MKNSKEIRPPRSLKVGKQSLTGSGRHLASVGDVGWKPERRSGKNLSGEREDGRVHFNLQLDPNLKTKGKDSAESGDQTGLAGEGVHNKTRTLSTSMKQKVVAEEGTLLLYQSGTFPKFVSVKSLIMVRVHGSKGNGPEISP